MERYHSSSGRPLFSFIHSGETDFLGDPFLLDREKSRFISSISDAYRPGKRPTSILACRSNCCPLPLISGFGSTIPIITRPTFLSAILSAQGTFGWVLVVQGSKVQ